MVLGSWDKKPCFVASGTLESLVNQAATLNPPADALVPCAGDESTRVGSCSGATVPGESSAPSLWATSLDTSGDGETELLRCTSASLLSSHEQENTTSSSSGRDSDGIPQLQEEANSDEAEEVGKRKQIGGIKSSVLRKRSRAAVHTQSERRRRDKIRQRMNTLHKIVSTSTKVKQRDKASMLEEIIEYIKQLQAQVQWMKMNMSEMMTIIIMMHQQQQQQPYLNMPTWLFPGMGVPDYNATLGCGMPPFGIGMPAPAPFMVPMPYGSWDIQGIDGYNSLPALYHQLQHPFASKNNNN